MLNDMSGRENVNGEHRQIIRTENIRSLEIPLHAELMSISLRSWTFKLEPDSELDLEAWAISSQPRGN